MELNAARMKCTLGGMTSKLQSALISLRQIQGASQNTESDARVGQITKALEELGPALEAEITIIDQKIATLESQIKHLGH